VLLLLTQQTLLGKVARVGLNDNGSGEANGFSQALRIAASERAPHHVGAAALAARDGEIFELSRRPDEQRPATTGVQPACSASWRRSHHHRPVHPPVAFILSGMAVAYSGHASAGFFPI
jgi:hypothetical protein